MKTILRIGLAVALAAGLAASLPAGEEMTVSGKVMCAKCALKKADASKCQDVLVTEGADGESVEYYIAQTEASKAFGHVCQNEKAATVTGTVEEEDGKMWISPSKMSSAD